MLYNKTKRDFVKNIKVANITALAFIFASSTPAYSCLPPQVSQAVSKDNQVNDVVNHLVGVMSTAAQTQTNPQAASVRMTTCKVTVTDTNNSINNNQTVFLYQEQAISNNLAKPYRQRFLKISPSNDGQSVESAGYKPTALTSLINFCNQPEAKRVISVNNIGKSECSVFLKRQGNTYVGETQAGGCPTNYKGAVRITNKIVLHQAGMDTMDRGYDASGKLVWGAKEKPYEFRWIEPKTN